MKSNILKFLQDNNLRDGLLQVFVDKGLWRPAIKSCNEAIDKRKKEIALLSEMKIELQKREEAK